MSTGQSNGDGDATQKPMTTPVDKKARATNDQDNHDDDDDGDATQNDDDDGGRRGKEDAHTLSQCYGG